MKDSEWMREVLRHAENALENGEVPVAAIVVSEGEELARGQSRAARDNTTAAHAEIQALLKAGDLWNKDELVLYTNLEPCVMCYGAAVRCGVDRIVYSMEAHCDGKIQESKNVELPEIKGKVLEKESVQLFRRFLEMYENHFGRSYVENLLQPYNQRH